MRKDELLASVKANAAPVLVCHGLQDRIVPFDAGRGIATKLQSAGVDVDFREYNMQHSTTNAELRDVQQFMLQRLKD